MELILILKFNVWQEDVRRNEEKDERKRKYNVKWNNEVFVFSECLPTNYMLLKTRTKCLYSYNCSTKL
jgi:G:T-mismatch repair DNA endonuclease (very short patch repair protein)